MRKMVKKFLRKANALLLAAAMAVTLLPTQVAAAAGPDDSAEASLLLQQVDSMEGQFFSQQRANDTVLDAAAVMGKEYTVIEGNTPVLPKQVMMTPDNGSMAPADIEWAEWDESQEAGKHTITGTANGKSLTVTVNVLPCDEEVEDVQAMGRQDGDTTQEKLNAIHPLKGYKGLFVAEYDIVCNDVKPTHDRAVIYLPAADSSGAPFSAESCWDYGARLQFKFGYNDQRYFQTQDGDGQDKDKAKYYPTDMELKEAIDKGETVSALKFDETQIYRVRTVMDTASDTTKGNVKTYITDPQGIEHEVTKPGGNGFRIYPTNGIVKNFAAIRGGYRMRNHKISWISGYVTKKAEIYLKGQDDADYVKEGEDTVSKELPGIIKYSPKTEIIKDSQRYALDTGKSGWYNGEEKVESVNAQEGDTVTYRAYYSLVKEIDQDTADAKEAMESSVAAAEQKVQEIKESEYTPASVKALKDALEACKNLNPETATKADYESKKAALDSAMAGLAKLADKAALNQAIADAKSKKEAEYEAASYKSMKEKLAKAETVAANPNVAQAEVDNAKNELLAAIGKLVKLEEKSPEVKAEVKVAAVKSAAKTYKIAAGKKLDLNKVFTVSPQNADNKQLNYSVDTKLAGYVSFKSGVVTLKKNAAGKTITIKATAADGSGKTATVKIKVMKNAVTKITVKKKSLTVKAGKKVKIKPVVKTNGKKANKTLSYTSSNPALATVKNGVVTTKKGKAGKVTITIKSTDGTNKSAKVKIKINK